MTDEEWAAYGESFDSDMTLYRQYMREKSGDNDSNRVYPTRVAKAEAAWYHAVEERHERATRIAQTLGIRVSEVNIEYLRWVYEKREAKGAKRG